MGRRYQVFFRHLWIGIFLGWQDVRDLYQRSVIGPLWLTLSLGLQVAVIGSIFVVLLRADSATYFPYLAAGLTFWSLITSSLAESSSAFVSSQNLLRQVYLPAFVPVIRVLTKSIIAFAHHLVVPGVVFLALGVRPNWSLLAVVPGFVLVFSVLFSTGLIFAMIGVRYRDFPPMVSTMLMLAFYVTPIVWMPGSLPDPFRSIVLNWNPLNHLMDLVRSPLLGGFPSGLSWGVGVALSLVMGLFAWLLVRTYSWRIVYWL